MEDIFDLSISEREKDFVKDGLDLELDILANILENLENIPYIGSLIKLGRLGKNFCDLHYMKKLARFLDKEQNLSSQVKEQFINSLDKNKRKKIYEYVVHYLLRAEDEEKADLMGYLYKSTVAGIIEPELFLRLCSVVDRSFIDDLKKLPYYVEAKSDFSITTNSFINLGLIDNFQGGVWIDEPSYKLNAVGMTLYQILNGNHWLDN